MPRSILRRPRDFAAIAPPRFPALVSGRPRRRSASEMPSPEEIAERAAKIRAGWSESTRASRSNRAYAENGWTLPDIDTREFLISE